MATFLTFDLAQLSQSDVSDVQRVRVRVIIYFDGFWSRARNHPTSETNTAAIVFWKILYIDIISTSIPTLNRQKFSSHVWILKF